MLLLSATEAVMQVPFWASIPFIIMLLMIAIGPLIAEEWWEHNRNKLLVSAILGIPTAFYLVKCGLIHQLEHQGGRIHKPIAVLDGEGKADDKDDCGNGQKTATRERLKEGQAKKLHNCSSRHKKIQAWQSTLGIKKSEAPCIAVLQP